MDWATTFGINPAQILGVGGDSYRGNNRAARKAYKYAKRYQPDITAANSYEGSRADIMGKLRAAKEGGLHPLFALGSSGAGGGSPAFDIPGQSETGSFRDAGVAIKGASKVDDASAKLINEQTKTEKVRRGLLESDLKNKVTGVGPGTESTEAIVKTMQEKGSLITKVSNDDVVSKTQGVTEIVPAEQFTTKEGDRSTHAADMSMRRKLFYTDKDWIFIPNVQELDSLMEEPMVALGIIAAMNPGLATKTILRILEGKGVYLDTMNKGSVNRTVSKGPFGLWRVKKKMPFQRKGRYPK